MENTKATSILNDIMEKLSLVKKDEVKEVEVKEEVNLSEQIKEEEEMSQKLTELACACDKEEKEDLASEEVVAEDLQEEVPVIEEASEEIEMDETKYVGRDEFESKISELKGMIEEMKLGYKEEKLSMEKEILVTPSNTIASHKCLSKGFPLVLKVNWQSFFRILVAICSKLGCWRHSPIPVQITLMVVGGNGSIF